MGFRTLEISNPSEVHVRKGQLEVTNDDGTFYVPLEDLMTITCIGSNIRMSTMAQAQIAEAGVSLMIIDEKYRPVCVLTPIEANVRQTLVMRKQISMPKEERQGIWLELIKQKIHNQARTLEILEKEGYEKVQSFTEDINVENVDQHEASAAREYFYRLDPRLNRRIEDPMNSCLNYGYAVLRNAIIRSAVMAGFLVSLGFHHDNYLNAFNLADDLIEPWRPFVDIIAVKDPGDSIVLSKTRRKNLAMVLHNVCVIDGKKLSVQTGIEEMILSIRNVIIGNEQNNIKVPLIKLPETIKAVKE